MKGIPRAIREDRLATIAAGFPYPKTPDLWPGVRLRLSVGRESGRRTWGRRLAFALAAVLLILAAGLAAVPQARAALLRSLRIGAVRIFLPEATATASAPRPSSVPPPTATIKVSIPPLDLAGLATLPQAAEALGSPVLLPTYPEGLGSPDFVFLQDWGGPLVILVWTRADDPAQPILALHMLGPGTFAGKGEPRVVGMTTVNGNPAAWTEGAHLMYLQSGRETLRNLVTGNVLIWEQDGLTYRLETDRTMEDAVRIAESLR
jgi:hypothetical protein